MACSTRWVAMFLLSSRHIHTHAVLGFISLAYRVLPWWEEQVRPICSRELSDAALSSCTPRPRRNRWTIAPKRFVAFGKCCSFTKPERSLSACSWPARYRTPSIALQTHLGHSGSSLAPSVAPATTTKIERVFKNLNTGFPDGNLAFHLSKREMAKPNSRTEKSRKALLGRASAQHAGSLRLDPHLASPRCLLSKAATDLLEGVECFSSVPWAQARQKCLVIQG